MTQPKTQFITVGEGAQARKIAFRLSEPAEAGRPTVMWLAGLLSDMVSTKAEALAAWTEERGLGCVRFDYSGHGESGGLFEDAVLSDWVEEAFAVFREHTRGPVIIAGSSTGGHVALLLLKRLMENDARAAARVTGLVLVAPAWDLTEELMWKQIPEEGRRLIMEEGKWMRPSDYDPRGYPITRAFIEDGRKDLIGNAGFDPKRPIRVLQGAQDRDVPLEHAERLAEVLSGDWVSFTIVPDGEHRLSRPEDLDKLFGLVSELV